MNWVILCVLISMAMLVLSHVLGAMLAQLHHIPYLRGSVGNSWSNN
jgi:hypothetical protein